MKAVAELRSIEETELKEETYENNVCKESDDSVDEEYTEEDMVEVACPVCHEEITFAAGILDDDDAVEVTCPYCGGVVYDNTPELEDEEKNCIKRRVAAKRKHRR